MSGVGRKVVKFEKTYTIIVKGSVETIYPEENPWNLKAADDMIQAVVAAIDSYQKSMAATLDTERTL